MKIIRLILVLMLIAVCAFVQALNWQWATQAGGSGSDLGSAIAIDDDGNSYVTGYFMGSAAFGSYSLTTTGWYDIFVAKMDATGNWLWATKAGASGLYHDQGLGITIDDYGNSYVTGFFEGTAIFGSFSLTTSVNSDIFVAKIDAIGNWLWATQAGGSGLYCDQGSGITIDDNGNSYVTGFFEGIATFGTTTLTSNGESDIFVAKMDADGNWLWSSKAGGNENDCGFGIAIDDDGNSYVTGFFEGTANFGSYSLTSSGSYEIFIAKMDANGNWLWSSKAGGNDWDESWGIAVDNDGNSYVTGEFNGTATFGSYSLFCIGWFDIFVAKMDANGNWLWATRASGGGLEYGQAIAIDDDGNSFVTGFFEGIATFGSTSLTSSGNEDIFVAKMDVNGNWLWAMNAGGSEHDGGLGIAIDDDGNSYLTGFFHDTATFGTYSLINSGGNNIFVAKLGNDTSVENEIIPTKLELSNFPNPFNPSTTISFSIHEESNVELTIFNIKGQKTKTLANNEFTKGNHSIIWNGDDELSEPVSSGVYLYKLNVNGNTEAVKKCLLLK
ncbi:MAG: SBBP repeat-containing protein [Candidatus Cloacimonetes bacterium]|nr:SBBP repeat-containing protein [Candidatus Cloacimonadota bacterium]